MGRFNVLYSLVQEDRPCPKAEVMEKSILAYCRSQAGLVDGHDAQGGEQGDYFSVSPATDATFLEGTLDLDNEERI
jgi:hypothetical protein